MFSGDGYDVADRFFTPIVAQKNKLFDVLYYLQIVSWKIKGVLVNSLIWLLCFFFLKKMEYPVIVEQKT